MHSSTWYGKQSSRQMHWKSNITWDGAFNLMVKNGYGKDNIDLWQFYMT